MSNIDIGQGPSGISFIGLGSSPDTSVDIVAENVLSTATFISLLEFNHLKPYQDSLPLVIPVHNHGTYMILSWM